jgi:HEAT repeat protein
MIIALIEAANQTFSADVVADSDVLACAAQVFALASLQPTPLSIGAALSLSKWIEAENGDDRSSSGSGSIADLRRSAKVLEDKLHTEELKQLVKSFITDAGAEPAQTRQAVLLAGDLKLADAVPDLLPMLAADHPLLESAISALGKIGDERAVQPLVDTAKKQVTLKERTALPLSKQPVGDDNPRSTKAYWLILKALGQIPSTEAIPYLIEATGDYAPDKRDQALSSLLTIFHQCKDNAKHPTKQVVDLGTKLQEVVALAVKDPSPQVRSTALEGAALLDQTELMGEIVRLTEAVEVSVSRKAFGALTSFSRNGHGKEVSTAVEAAMRAHTNTFHQKRLSEFLSTQKSSH